MAAPISVFRGRIGRVLVTLLVLCAVVGGAGIASTIIVSHQVTTVTSEHLRASVHLSSAERALWSLRFALPNYALVPKDVREEISSSTKRDSQQIIESIRAYENSSFRTDDERIWIAAWHEHYDAYMQARPRFFALIDAGEVEQAMAHRERETNPPAQRCVMVLEKLIALQNKLAAEREKDARLTAVTAIVATAILLLVALALGIRLGRSARLDISQAVAGLRRSVGDIEGGSTALQFSAKEFALASKEISETLSRLLDSSKQIAESGQSLANIAEETGASAQIGDTIAQDAGVSLDLMRDKVGEIVKSMGVLDQNSAEIDSIVDIINELSQQTNILSINATIEAAGAGRAGLRFAVVADEIRKLAGRVGASSRDIRELTRAVHDATLKTQTATHEGERAVKDGSRQFTEVLEAFRVISGKVVSTTDATREIELSTKQQTTAVAQVNAAMEELARSASEAEDSALKMTESCAELRDIEHRLGGLAG